MTRADLRRLPAAVPARPQATASVGRWELVQMVAEGPLARVYRARPSEASPQQAPAYSLKMLRKEWQEDPKAVASLHCEAEAGRSVANPHLIPVLAARLSGPPYYLVMPWLEGRTLGAHLASPAPLDLPMVLWIVRQVAEGLAAMDDAGWVHGDVKPANIFVSPDGHATLLDLGFARRPGQSGSIADRCVLGTCSYMAPEVMTSALGADIRSDLYSLGVVLFEALAGRLPFTGNTLSQMVEQHKQARPPLLRRLRPAVPTGVADLVAALLSKQPLRRPQTPRELIRRLVELEIETFAERASSPGA